MNSRKGFFSLPEIDLGLEFPPGIKQMLIHKLPGFICSDLILSGKRASAAELVRVHVIHNAVDGPEETLNQALEFAGGFNKDRANYEKFKTYLNGKIAADLVKLDSEYFRETFYVN